MSAGRFPRVEFLGIQDHQARAFLGWMQRKAEHDGAAREELLEFARFHGLRVVEEPIELKEVGA